MKKACMAAAAALLLVAAIMPRVDAGCYRNGRTRPVLAEHEQYHNHQPVPQLTKEEMPKNFNWCDLEGKNWCAPSWNQHIPAYCGSCWLHGTLSMIQDRIKIGKQGRGEDVMLGRQSLLNCAPLMGFSGGCDGGDPIDVFRYMAKEGLPDESCAPYEANDSSKYPAGTKKCPADGYCRNCMPVNGTDTCWAIKTPIKYTLKSYGKVHKADTVEGMMSEILQRGPITCGIACPEELTYGYRGGVYSGANDTEIDHDIEVVGWGKEDGVEYWNIRNSWGTFWGELGFFRIPRGVNSIMLESGDCWYAVPDWSMEDEVLAGKMGGSMYGLVDMRSGAAEV